jgi:AraC-like DNA-binding protein
VPDEPSARAILELESGFWRFAGVKDAQIRERLGMSSTRYYQLLNEVLDEPPAELAVEFGQLLNRLRRLRAQRLRQRSARRRSA